MLTNEGAVETILPGGEGVIRLADGHSLLIQDVVEGDHIRYQPLERRRGAQRGKLLEIVKPGSARVKAPCSVASTCGGCALQSMTINEQHRVKTSWVTQAFSPFITANTTLIPLDSQPQEYAGRRRVRWFVKKQQLGFRKRLSHAIVHTSQCIALSQSLDALRNQLEISLSTLPASLQSIQAIELSNGSHIILESEQDKPTELNLPALSGCNWWWRKIGTPSIKLISSASPALFDNIDLRPFADSSIEIEIGPNDFIQGQQQGNQELIEQILRWSKGSKRVVDLFCGAGNLSLPVASALGAKVIGAEANASSVKAANANAKRLKLDADYQLLDLFGQFATEPFIGADTLILDPPRKGAKRICKMMASLFPKQVIMVNCDVASGARDAQALHQAGFRLQELRPLDLFPYTGHVEVLSLWKP